MPRMMIWLAAGGSALAGATLTYIMTRARLSPAGVTVRNNWSKARRTAGRAASWPLAFASTNKPDARQMEDSFTSEGGTDHSAFDEYRDSTLQALANDEREFQDYLERLRHAKDRLEFDQFMSNRKHGLTGAK